MNFLAHLTLSCQDPALQMGNLLGDFTKGKPPANYPAGILKGLKIHRLIDQTTDAHPAVKSLNKQLKTRHGRYAGVVSDIVFDLYLYKHWERFGPGSFVSFADEAYATIGNFLPILEPKLAVRFQNMVTHRWLNTYRSREGITSVFKRMKPRFSKPEKLNDIHLTLEEMDGAFNETFLALFPDLQQTVNQACGCID